MKLDTNTVAVMKHALNSKDENKTRVTLRLDNEIIDFFKANSNQYQSAINRVLKAFVEELQH